MRGLGTHILIAVAWLLYFQTLEAQNLFPGDLLLTEFMANPDRVSDSSGEYLELYNTTPQPILLSGCMLHDLDQENHVIGDSVIIGAGQFLVLANSNDPGGDGGQLADYVYTGFSMSNGADEIVLSCSDGPTVITQYSYDNGDPFGPGVALELKDISLASGGLLDATDWIAATSSYGLGDKGSPGLPGQTLLDQDLKGEPFEHVSNFQVTGQVRSVIVIWEDVTGSPAPDAYLIHIVEDRANSDFKPSDGNYYANDTDLNDGLGFLNISQGIQKAVFQSLKENTIYYLSIYPYTNSGASTNYITDGMAATDSALTLRAPRMVLNEFLADPPGSGSADLLGDANKDGVRSSDDDEFIEWVNMEDSVLVLSQWSVKVGGNTVYVFPEDAKLKPMQALVVFGGKAADTDFGGSLVYSSTSLKLSNSGGSIQLLNRDGIQILSHEYGAEAGKNSSITRYPDLTGQLIAHTMADSINEAAFSPGFQVNGETFQARAHIQGPESWHMLSAPANCNTYSGFLEPIWTQGSAYGADVSAGGSNIYIYTEDGFNPLMDLRSPMIPGQGFLVYIFADDNNDGISDGFPKMLDSYCGMFMDPVTVPLNAGSESWSIAGNPYRYPIAWNNLDKTNLSESVYVYDAQLPGYRSWNGITGNIIDGIIAPFQGFWVQNLMQASSSVLNISISDTSEETILYKLSDENVADISLKANWGRHEAETYLSFNREGSEKRDPFDALYIKAPWLGGSPPLVLTTLSDSTHLSINNLPFYWSGQMEIPLVIEINESEKNIEPGDSMVALSWDLDHHIPENWSVHLHEQKSGRDIDMRKDSLWPFPLHEILPGTASASEPDSKYVLSKTGESMPDAKMFKSNHTVYNVTLWLVLSQLKNTKSEKKEDAAGTIELHQNFPNPFNPVAVITFSVPDPSEVRIQIFDGLGRMISNNDLGLKYPGTHRFQWNGSRYSSGIYYYRLVVGEKFITRKMTLIK